jgi:hypothetical protein
MAGIWSQQREKPPGLEFERIFLPSVDEWNPRPIRIANQWLQQPSFRPMTRNIVHPPIRCKQEDQNHGDRNQDADCNWIDSGLASRCGRYPLFREVPAARICHLTTMFRTMYPQASRETGSLAKGTLNEDRCKFLGGYWAPLFQLPPAIDNLVSRFNVFRKQFFTHSTFRHHSNDYRLQDVSCQDSEVCQYD